MLLSVGKKAVDENLRVSSGVAESVDDVLRAAETEEVRQVHRRGLDQIGDPCIVEVRHDAETSGNELGRSPVASSRTAVIPGSRNRADPDR